MFLQAGTEQFEPDWSTQVVFSNQVSSLQEVGELGPICYSWSKVLDSPQAVGDPQVLYCWVMDGWMDRTVEEERVFCKESVS